MSYRSRLYNHRNAQSPEGKQEQPFFSNKNSDKKNSKSAFFQAKLSVNELGDAHEKEADNVADAVVNKKSAGTVPQQKSISSVQRLSTSKEDEQLGTNDQRMKHDKDIQRAADPEKEKEEKGAGTPVQKKPDSGNASTASPALSSKIENTSGKGSPLPKNTLHEMNTSFGRDFSNVNIHHDNDAGAMNEELNARAFTHGKDIYFSKGAFNPEHTEGKHLLAHELTHVVQQGESKKEDGVQRDTKTAKKSMLDQFAEKFPDSIDIIKKSPEALALIKDATDAGVEFGGFSEEGPGKNAWAYTAGSKIYVPKAHKADKVTAASDFLFELNNGIHSTAFEAIHTEAGKGSKGTLDAKTYAKKKVEIEVDGMLRLGKVWVEMKKNKPKGENWDSHDGEYYLSEYQDFKDGKKTKDDIVKNVLARTYTEGKDAGKTVEQFYMDQYNRISNGK